MASRLSHEVDEYCAEVEGLVGVAQVSAALWPGETVEQRWREAGSTRSPACAM